MDNNNALQILLLVAIVLDSLVHIWTIPTADQIARRVVELLKESDDA